MAENGPASKRRWWQIILGCGYCTARSPEGYQCRLRYQHDGLHVPRKGRGWAWGGDYTSPRFRRV